MHCLFCKGILILNQDHWLTYYLVILRGTASWLEMLLLNCHHVLRLNSDNCELNYKQKRSTKSSLKEVTEIGGPECVK